MFNSLKLNGVCYESIFKISSAIRGTELSKNKLFEKATPEERKRQKHFNEFLDISNPSSDKKSVKNDSPFQNYYENKIEYFKTKIQLNSNETLSANEFYCPELFNILKSQLYLLPIWSGIMLKNRNIGYDNKTRLSNNAVENWIGQLKNNILKNDVVSFFLSNI